jgi:hypothetical protein
MITPQTYFALVQRHLTQPMLDAGHHKIGEFDHPEATPTSVLRSAGPCLRNTRFRLLRKRSSEPKVRELAVGYELSDIDEEKWITYHPETGELDLIDWREVLEGHADWDVWFDNHVPNEEELERRLVVLSHALRRAADG